MERKACIEFINYRTIRITTPFKQKEFDIIKTGHQRINLVDLKLVPKPANFYTMIYGKGSLEWPYCVEVYVITANNMISDIGTLTVKERVRVFKVTIPQE